MFSVHKTSGEKKTIIIIEKNLSTFGVHQHMQTCNLITMIKRYESTLKICTKGMNLLRELNYNLKGPM